MPRPLLNTEQRAIAESYLAGDTYAEIMKKHGRNKSTIDGIIRALGLPRRRRKYTPRFPPGTIVDYGNPNRPKKREL